MISTLAFAFIAGGLSILSPCVLPLLPMVFSASYSQNRLGPIAVATGLVISFTAIGMFLAVFGFSLGITVDHFRIVSSIIVILFGLILLSNMLQDYFAGKLSHLMSKFGIHANVNPSDSLLSQFLLGLLLGAVWGPCVGPTLGAASVMAAQRENLFEVSQVMVVFGLGTAFALIALGTILRKLLFSKKAVLIRGGSHLKKALGVSLIAVGVLILTGTDKLLEAYLVSLSPEWLTALTTRF
jgi:cytochrome c biogenesis protein CcdA